MSLKIINFPTTVVNNCIRPDLVGAIPYSKDCGECSPTITSLVAPVNPTLTTAPAIAYREAHKNQYVKFGAGVYFIDMYANVVQIS